MTTARGVAATLRSTARRALRTVGGAGLERRIHLIYHAALRRSGRFDPPEDPATLAMLRTLASRARTLIDVGANVGKYTHFFLQTAPRDARVVAFEPNPEARDLLRANTRDRRLAILGDALGAESARQSLWVPVDASGNPVSGLGHLADPRAEERTIAYEIEIRALDDLVSAGSVPLVAPVLAKIDVEGHEVAVLTGARSLLAAGAAFYFECEAEHLERAGTTPETLWALLVDAGYQVWGMGATEFVRYDALDAQVWNYLALPSRQPEGDIAQAIEAWAGGMR